MSGKEEIQRCGFMTGCYVAGGGKAHKYHTQHIPIFNCKMCGKYPAIAS